MASHATPAIMFPTQTNTHILFQEFEYFEPATTAEAVSLLNQLGNQARLMAGGTDLLVQMKMERRQPNYLIALHKVSELSGIRNNDGLTIGAMTSIRSLYKSPIIQKNFHALAEACDWFSTVQIMVMGTIGGNLCNASPAADSAPCLLVFDAELSLISNSGTRSLPTDKFFLGPGKAAMRDDELLTQVHLPQIAPFTGSAFIKVSRVVADISKVCAAAKLVRKGDTVQEARIALGSVAATPMRALRAEDALRNQPFTAELAAHAGQIASEEIKPIDDVRSTSEYRREVAGVIVRDALLRAWERAGETER